MPPSTTSAAPASTSSASSTPDPAATSSRPRAAVAGSTGRVRRVTLGSGERIECDLLVTAVGWTAPTTLLNLAGDRPAFSAVANRFLPGGLAHPSVLATGGLAGDGSLDALIEHGQANGREAASRAGSGTATAIPELPVVAHPPLFRSRTHGMVDFSEDVSSKDIVAAAAEGYDSIELVKRFTTATMGPAQGKLETVNLVAVLAEANSTTIEETGTTVWRPPYAPITLGALAGRGFEPVRYSPMQPWHEAHGASPLVAGDWIRPDHYGDPEAEVRNVRSNVGIIDVTPLGKLDLRGPDVAELLNLLYVNLWSKLAIGGVRYGVMCAEDGVVLDDGVTGRLGPEHYVMTTTSSGAGTVWEWILNWLQTEHPEWRVHVTPVTTAFASMNLAGPASRELLARLVTDVDLAPESFKYMQVRQGTVAGVAGCFMWRIGFTGELSYELHVPAAYGLHVWEACLEAGANLGIRAFGVEAQRIMRLEKGHFIVGQDTDGLTQAFAVGLGSLVKLEKQDFAGRPELVWQQERGDYQRLVGLQPVDPRCVPAEGCQIIERGRRVHADRRPHHVEPDVADAGPLDLPRLRGAASVTPGRGGQDPSAGRHGRLRARDGTTRPLRSRRGAAPWLSRRSLARRSHRLPRSPSWTAGRSRSATPRARSRCRTGRRWRRCSSTPTRVVPTPGLRPSASAVPPTSRAASSRSGQVSASGCSSDRSDRPTR